METSGFAAALQRCATYMAQPSTEPSLPSLAMKRALQHSDYLKWQQDMFHRLLHLLCLSKEGLASQQQIVSCKSQVLTFLESTHPEGEWPEFTRDKLLFLQDLLFASCISESEYHAAKKPLILRLADQGAIIDAEDFIFDSSTSSDTKVMKAKSMARRPSTRRAKARSMAEPDISKTPTRKNEADANATASSASPLKQVMGAVRRLNSTPSRAAVKTERECSPLKVPHALDFLRPEHCPIRDPPSTYLVSPHQARERTNPSMYNVQQEEAASVTEPACEVDNTRDGDECNFLTSPPSSPKCGAAAETTGPLLGHASPVDSSNATTPSRFRNMLTGLIHKRTPQAEGEKSSNMPQSLKKQMSFSEEEEKASSASKSSRWNLEIFRFPRKLQLEQEDTSVGNPNKTSGVTDYGTPGAQLLPLVDEKFQSPNTKNLKKQVLSKGAQSEFFIDKVLGENIKNELSRIRVEMNREQPGQTFSNEQIDAIATKLPMDKGELKKYFPQTWCEKYGDVVLDVVQKEFKEHVGEMQKLGKGGKGKPQLALLSPSSHNDDENMEVPSPQKEFKEHVGEMQKLGKGSKGKPQLAVQSPSYHNDENMEVLSPREHNYHHHHHKQQQQPRTPDFSKCFTNLDENSPAKSTASFGSSLKKKPFVLGSPRSPSVEKSKCKVSLQHRYSGRVSKDTISPVDNLDRQLEEEILKIPLARRTNEYVSQLRV